MLAFATTEGPRLLTSPRPVSILPDRGENSQMVLTAFSRQAEPPSAGARRELEPTSRILGSEFRSAQGARQPFRRLRRFPGSEAASRARSLKRPSQRKVEKELARQILRGAVQDGQTVVMDARDGKLTFTPKDGEAQAASSHRPSSRSGNPESPWPGRRALMTSYRRHLDDSEIHTGVQPRGGCPGQRAGRGGGAGDGQARFIRVTARPSAKG